MGLDDGEQRAARRVVVVDDDLATRELLATILADEGYEVAAFASGQAALELLKESTPDLILLDLRLAGSDGADFARAYRQSGGWNARMIIITAMLRASERAAELGADGYLEKPFDLEDLLSLVDRCSRPREHRGRPQAAPEHLQSFASEM